MNRAECQKLINSYVDWLRQGISVEEVGTACELTTPFLDRHNDHLQVYATRRNGNIILSDGQVILISAGFLFLATLVMWLVAVRRGPQSPAGSPERSSGRSASKV